MLNKFRMLIHPSSGACDFFVELFHGLYCSGSMCVGVTLWYGFVGVSVCTLKHCWCYVVVWLWWCGIRMQVEALLVLRCGLAVVVWYLYAGWSTTMISPIWRQIIRNQSSYYCTNHNSMMTRHNPRRNLPRITHKNSNKGVAIGNNFIHRLRSPILRIILLSTVIIAPIPNNLSSYWWNHFSASTCIGYHTTTALIYRGKNSVWVHKLMLTEVNGMM